MRLETGLHRQLTLGEHFRPSISRILPYTLLERGPWVYYILSAVVPIEMHPVDILLEAVIAPTTFDKVVSYVIFPACCSIVLFWLFCLFWPSCGPFLFFLFFLVPGPPSRMVQISGTCVPPSPWVVEWATADN